MNTPIRTLAGGIALLFVLAFIHGCTLDNEGSGDIKVHWIIPVGTCESLGIKYVKIHVLFDGYDAIYPPPTADCGAGLSGVVIDGVLSGVYSVVVRAYDANGESVYEGMREEVRVEDGVVTTLLPIPLTLRKASVRLLWGFENGLVCGANAVRNVSVAVYDSSANTVADTREYLCELPYYEMAEGGGLLLSNLPGDDELTVWLLGISDEGVPLHTGRGTVETAPGQVSDLTIIMQACGNEVPCM